MAAVESDRAPRVTRRGFLMTGGSVAARRSLVYVVGRGVTYSGSQVATRSAGGGLKAFAANVVPGGPGKDGIPAIDRPRFIVPRARRSRRRNDGGMRHKSTAGLAPAAETVRNLTHLGAMPAPSPAAIL